MAKRRDGPRMTAQRATYVPSGIAAKKQSYLDEHRLRPEVRSRFLNVVKVLMTAAGDSAAIYSYPEAGFGPEFVKLSEDQRFAMLGSWRAWFEAERIEIISDDGKSTSRWRLIRRLADHEGWEDFD